MPKAYELLVTCEHASAAVPPAYRGMVPAKLLKTHRGLDIGALELARAFSKRFNVPLVCGEVSRLFVDLNRGASNRKTLFSKYVPKDCRKPLFDRYYRPYYSRVVHSIDKAVKKKKVVLHLSVHSFTPVLRGKKRTTDIGLLFDPKRKSEREFCYELRRRLKQLDSSLKVHFNAPYRGTDDGLTKWLRGKYKPSQYLGIELETNQKFPLSRKPQEWNRLRHHYFKAFESLLQT